MPSLPPRWCACPLSGCPSRGHHRPRDSRLADRHQSASVPRSRRGRPSCRRRIAGRADGPRRHNRLLPVAICRGRRTIKCNGQNMRIMGHGKPFESGVDAPEISRAKCQKERILDQQAKRHLEELLRQPGTQIEDSVRVTATAGCWCG